MNRGGEAGWRVNEPSKCGGDSFQKNERMKWKKTDCIINFGLCTQNIKPIGYTRISYYGYNLMKYELQWKTWTWTTNALPSAIIPHHQIECHFSHCVFALFPAKFTNSNFDNFCLVCQICILNKLRMKLAHFTISHKSFSRCKPVV